MNKYRIKQIFPNKFVIEIWSYEIKGILWKRHKEWDWFDTNKWGEKQSSNFYYPVYFYKSLDEAKSKIEEFNFKPKYYYV